MTGQTSSSSLGTGSLATTAGIAVLPNTTSGSLANILTFALIACGLVILLSFVVLKATPKKSK